MHTNFMTLLLLEHANGYKHYHKISYITITYAIYSIL